MSKEQTDKNRYPSKYSPGEYVQSAQYILELLCEKQAQFEKTELPIKFWNIKKWKTLWMKQLRKVHKLLTLYSDKAIIRAINNNNIRSALTPWFEDKIKLEQHILMYEENKPQSIVINRPDKIVLKSNKKINSILEKLDG